MSLPYTKRIFIGNVIEDPNTGYKWIVSDTTDTTVSAVSFDSASVFTVQELEDHKETHSCFECNYDPSCENCNGMGYTTSDVKGWKHAEVLATNVKEFILQGVKHIWRI